MIEDRSTLEIAVKKDEERAALQRRIKNQRKALRRLNRQIITQNFLLDRYRMEVVVKTSNTYRHAAQIAESFWFGQRIARALRQWC